MGPTINGKPVAGSHDGVNVLMFVCTRSKMSITVSITEVRYCWYYIQLQRAQVQERRDTTTSGSEHNNLSLLKFEKFKAIRIRNIHIWPSCAHRQEIWVQFTLLFCTGYQAPSADRSVILFLPEVFIKEKWEYVSGTGQGGLSYSFL